MNLSHDDHDASDSTESILDCGSGSGFGTIIESDLEEDKDSESSDHGSNSTYSFDFGHISQTLVLCVSIYYVALIGGFSESGLTTLLKILESVSTKK